MSFNYRFKGVTVTPTNAASYGGVVSGEAYRYEIDYGRLTAISVPQPPGTIETSSDGVQFAVAATVNGWQGGTLFPVNVGDILVTTATGTVVWNGVGGTSGPDGVDHAPARYDERFAHEALLGKIGDTVYLLGSSWTFTATQAGYLTFRTNDLLTDDNAGSFNVVVAIAGSGGGTLSWSASTSASVIGYYVAYSSDSGLTWSTPVFTSATSIALDSLGMEPSTQYLIGVAAATSQTVGAMATKVITTPVAQNSLMTEAGENLLSETNDLLIWQ